MFRLWVAAVMAVFAMGVQTGTTLSGSPDPSSITIEKPVHFSASDGSDVVASAGIYRVEQVTDMTLRLIPLEGKTPFVIQAQATTHDESIAAPLALSIPQPQDEHHVVLLRPDGNALDAAGTYSGVKTRAARTLRLDRPMIQDYMLTQQLLSTGGSTPPPPPPNLNPDLVITSAAMTPRSPTPYDLAVLHVTVMNEGKTDARLDSLTTSQMFAGMRHLSVQLWDSGGNPVKGWGLEPTNLPVTIPAGGAQVLTVSQVTLLTDVVGTLKWDITLNSYITEANVGNNMYSTNVTVQPRPPITGPAPDLALKGCSFTPMNPTQQDNIQVMGQYTNAGTVSAILPSTATLLKLSSSPPIGGREFFRWGVGWQVSPGVVQSFQVPLNITQAAPGKYQIAVVLDPDDRVAESDKRNNSATCVLVVAP